MIVNINAIGYLSRYGSTLEKYVRRVTAGGGQIGDLVKLGDMVTLFESFDFNSLIFYNSKLAGNKLNSGNVEIAYDISKYKNDASQTNTDYQPVLGHVYDGVNDYLYSLNSSSLNIGYDNFCVGMWVKTSNITLDTEYRRIIDKNGANGGFSLMYKDDGLLYIQFDDAGSAIAGYYLNDNQWHSILVNFNRENYANVYINNIYRGQKNISGKTSTNILNSTNMYIGKYAVSDAGHHDGDIDEVTIIKDVLTDSERTSLITTQYKNNSYRYYTDNVTGNSGTIQDTGYTQTILDYIGENIGWEYCLLFASRQLGNIIDGLNYCSKAFDGTFYQNHILSLVGSQQPLITALGYNFTFSGTTKSFTSTYAVNFNNNLFGGAFFYRTGKGIVDVIYSIGTLNFEIYLGGGNSISFRYGGTPFGTTAYMNDTELNTWIYFSFQIDKPNNSIYIYKNNIYFYTIDITGLNSVSSIFYIGALNPTYGFSFTGIMNDFHLMNKLLTTVEREELFNNLKTKYGL